MDELANFFVEGHLAEEGIDAGFDFGVGKLGVGGVGLLGGYCEGEGATGDDE